MSYLYANKIGLYNNKGTFLIILLLTLNQYSVREKIHLHLET